MKFYVIDSYHIKCDVCERMKETQRELESQVFISWDGEDIRRSWIQGESRSWILNC